MTTIERDRDARAKAHALMESEDGRCNFIDRGAWSGEHIPLCDRLTAHILERDAERNQLRVEQDAAIAELTTWRARAEKAEALLTTWAKAAGTIGRAKCGVCEMWITTCDRSVEAGTRCAGSDMRAFLASAAAGTENPGAGT